MPASMVLCRVAEAATFIASQAEQTQSSWSVFMNDGRIIIIGAGMAGAATAYHLTRKGLRNIRLLEKEKIAGAQSTGRNAAILRTMIPDP
ncbi:MAG TPA: FAD-dependent oxidoreductase, partial [Acidobacteriota bacterium]|nr:FAD-dependent oxidoreductase [Acidobacteriota bacterium]